MRRSMDAVIVDRDQNGRAQLYRELSKMPGVNVVGEARTSTDGYGLIRRMNPDVVFMDVHHPLSNGFDLLDRFDTPSFLTVIYTSVADFALDAIKRNAADYLLKPLDYAELLSCIQKLQQRIFAQHDAVLMYRKMDVYARGVHKLIRHSNICYVQACGSYSSIHLIDGTKMVVSKNLKSIAESLGDEYFFRVHNSYIVNLTRVSECHFGLHQIRMQDGALLKMAVRRSEGLKILLERIWSPGPFATTSLPFT